MHQIVPGGVLRELIDQAARFFLDAPVSLTRERDFADATGFCGVG